MINVFIISADAVRAHRRNIGDVATNNAAKIPVLLLKVFAL
jgi:hypothetical protein